MAEGLNGHTSANPLDNWVADHSESTTDWCAPVDLWKSYPAPSLRKEWLPCALQEFVFEQAELTGTDAAIIGISALVACAGAMHDGYRLCPQQHNTTWKESARLWGAVVGDPSTKKSPGMSKALAGIRKLDAELGERAEQEKEHFEITSKIYEKELNTYVTKKAKGDRAERPEKPDRPLNRRILVEDTTVEAMSEVLSDNLRGVLVFRDELSSWFGQMDAYSASGGGASKDRGNWLEIYNGGPRRIDRIARGNKIVPNWSACVLGGIQPDAIRRISKKLDHDGLLQRFMIVIGRTGSRGLDREANMTVIRAYSALLKRLYEMEPRQRDEDLDKETVFRLSPGAQAISNAMSDFIHRLMVSGGVPKSMVSYLGKWDGLFARLLCAYHVIGYASEHMEPPPIVDEGSARAVEGLMKGLLLPHALTFYEEVLNDNERLTHAKWIAGLILTRGLTEIRIGDVASQYSEWRTLDAGTKLEAFNILQECDWLRPDYTGNVDRLTRMPKRFKVNPLVAEIFRGQAQLEMAARKAARELLTSRVAEPKEIN